VRNVSSIKGSVVKFIFPESVWGCEYAVDQTVWWTVHIPKGKMTSSIWSTLTMNSGWLVLNLVMHTLYI